jgi:hypothetical protein
MSKLTGAALDRAVANAMGLKSVNNCEQWGKEMTEEDDDIQEYKKPWVGLTEDEVDEIYTSVQEEVNRHWDKGGTTMMFPFTLYKAIEKALKERNT